MRVPIVMEIPIDVREMMTCPLKQDGVGKSFGMSYPLVWGLNALDRTWFGGCERKCPLRKESSRNPKESPVTCPILAVRSGERKCPCWKEAATIPKQTEQDEVAKSFRKSCPIAREFNCAAFRNSGGSRCPCRKEAVRNTKETPLESGSASDQDEVAKSFRKSCPIAREFNCASFRNSGGSRCPCRKEAVKNTKETPLESGSASDQDEVAKSFRKSCPIAREFNCAAFRNSGGSRCPCRKEASRKPNQTPMESGSASDQEEVAKSFGMTCPIIQGLKAMVMFPSSEGSKCPCKKEATTKPKETGSDSEQEGVTKRSNITSPSTCRKGEVNSCPCHGAPLESGSVAQQDEAAKSSEMTCPIKFRSCKARKCPCQKEAARKPKESRENVSVSNEDGVTVALDVHNYKPSELTVKVVDDFVVIEGNAEEQELDGGSVSRQFVRKIIVPEHCNKDEMVYSTSSDGILTVSIPAKMRPATTERIITIQKLDKPTNTAVEANTEEEIQIPVNIGK